MATASALALARALARLADQKKGEDVVAIDISAQHSLIECFVIVTARSSRHALVLGEEALSFVKSRGLKPWHLEVSADWVCGDFGDVVLHVFSPQAREYYSLEHLWADAEPIHWTPAPAGDTVLAEL